LGFLFLQSLLVEMSSIDLMRKFLSKRVKNLSWGNSADNWVARSIAWQQRSNIATTSGELAYW
jgi:hypothetical protein